MDIKLIEETFDEISKVLGWSVDKRIALAVTNIYLVQNRKFDAAAHQEAAKIIKKNEGWTSPLKSYMHHITAAFLTLQEEDAETGLKMLNEKQQELNQAGFRKTAYTYIAALIMNDVQEAAAAKTLYDEMKEHHKFLTSNEDVPYAVLLGRQEGTAEERAETMNRYYKDLREQGFYMGNDLQWLSQVMTFNSPIYDPKTVGRVVAMRDYFQQEKIKIRGAQYPILGFLAVAKADGPALNTIVDETKKLEQTKLFKWYKDLAFSTAVQFVMRDTIEARDVSAVTFSASLEMLMQAQQAAMMVSVNAAIISANANSGQ